MSKIDRGLLLSIMLNLQVKRDGGNIERPLTVWVKFEDGMIGPIDTGELVQYVADEYDKGLTRRG